jgi:glutamate/tyrosine decarboxylase-like PLP-dependent enzyme
VDGAFGLWAAAVPRLAHLTAGVELADSWATDAHKTLNVPYDCGVAIVADPSAMRAAFGLATTYLIHDETGIGDLHDRTPELSRRARGIPVWALLRSLGRQGVVELVDRLARRASELAAGVRAIDGAEVLNDVVLTQVCVAFGDDERTRAVTRRLIADGEVWMSGSRWRGRDVVRISVSNWSTDEADVARSLAALRRAAETS